jgi:hypothetical protein
MKKTYNQVVEYLEEVGNKGMNEVFTGSIWDVDKTKRNYPLLVIDPFPIPDNYTSGLYTLNVDLWFMDLIYDDNSNEQEVISDMILTCIDYINILRLRNNEYIRIRKDNINISKFTEKFDDIVSGVKVSVKVDIPDGGNRCKNIFV